MSIIIKKLPNTEHTIYATIPDMKTEDGAVQQFHAETDTELSFPSGSRGFIVFKKGEKVEKVVKVGKVFDVIRISNRRDFSFHSGMKSGIILNGTSYTHDTEGFVWFSNPECFIKNEEGLVMVEMANNGLYCVNNEALFIIEGIKMNSPLKVVEEGENESTVRFFKCKTEELASVHYDGFIETSGNMLTFEKSRIVFDANATPNELLYVKYNDGSFADVVFPETKTYPIYLPESYKGTFNLLGGYRCSTVSLPRISKPDDSRKSIISVDVVRYDQTSPTLKFECNWLSQLEMSVHSVYITSYHPNQKLAFDLGKYDISSTDPLESLFSENDETKSSLMLSTSKLSSRLSVEKLVPITQWYTKLNCKFSNGNQGTIVVYRDMRKVSEKKKEMVRFDNTSILGPFTSNKVYMLNDTIFTESSEGAVFENDSLTIRPKFGMKQFGVFSEIDNVWHITELRHSIHFNEQYTMNIMAPRTEVQMKCIGFYDPADTFKFFDGTTELSKGRYKVKASSDISSGTVIENKLFTAVHIESGKKYSFKVEFIYQEFNRVSFIVSDDDDFSTPLFRRLSFKGEQSEPFWTYGPFVSKAGKSIFALGNEVVNGSLNSNVFPVITFNEPSSGYVNKTDGSLPLITKVLDEDMTIKLDSGDEYFRLNGCGSVKFENSTIIVPKNVGLAFFRAGANLYLLRSATMRSLSFERSPSERRQPLSLPASASASPKADVEASPPAQTLEKEASPIPMLAPAPAPVSAPSPASIPINDTQASSNTSTVVASPVVVSSVPASTPTATQASVGVSQKLLSRIVPSNINTIVSAPVIASTSAPTPTQASQPAKTTKSISIPVAKPVPVQVKKNTPIASTSISVSKTMAQPIASKKTHKPLPLLKAPTSIALYA